MPLLKREVDLFPRDLFELPAEEYPWWIAYVRSRQEKVVARHAASAGVPFYLPQVEKTVHRLTRKLRSFLPLFPGYVFLRGGDPARQLMYRSAVIVGTIDVVNQELLTHELRQLHDLQCAGAVLRPVTHLRAGDRVRVVEGPFRGYEGEILREKGELRLIVQISALHRAVSVEFDRDSVALSRFHMFTRRPRPVSPD